MSIAKSVLLSRFGREIDELVLSQQSRRGSLWMPNDLLFPRGNTSQRVAELRHAAKLLQPAEIAVWALNLITEENLPSYFYLLMKHLGANGTLTLFREWVGIWTAEENRHGQLINNLSVVSGLIPDMSLFEREQYNAIRAGFNPDWGHDPYKLFAYASIQEVATQVSHAKLSLRCKERGAEVFVQPLALISAEESHHGRFYAGMVKLLFECDTDRMMISLSETVAGFVMPGVASPLYRDLADVAIRLGIFGPDDFVTILDKLLIQWNVEGLVLKDEAACRAKTILFRRIAATRKIAKKKPAPREFSFSFLGDRKTFTL